ncbi:MAG: Hsp20/alpha crystallin family protein [Spirochaetales bacterium]|nr:Hsp20/alpha crystallin family protein [Spirochaetales bacterium]
MDDTTIRARYDIRREEDQVSLVLEMPGVEKEALDIKIEGDHLLVEGSRRLPQIEGRPVLREIRPNDYRNVFTLDETIDRNKIEAQLRDGLVTVSLGIREAQKPRKIKVIAR